MSQPSSIELRDSYAVQEQGAKVQEEIEEYRKNKKEYWNFETVQGIFKQAAEDTDPVSFNYLNEHFGKVGSWEQVFERLDQLNKASKPNECYKIFFLARHGEGFHNVGNAKYGTKEWNEYWSKVNGDAEITWGPDAELTEVGRLQAKANNEQWKVELKHGCRLASKWFVSPFSRSIDTFDITWNDIIDLEKVKPVITEEVRETIGIHTCDMRSSRSVIAKKFSSKGFVFEPDFAEEDIYFDKNNRETAVEQAMRLNNFFQKVFELDEDVINITSHSGTIRVILLIIGHRVFPVGTGGMIPVCVKGTKVEKKE